MNKNVFGFLLGLASGLLIGHVYKPIRNKCLDIFGRQRSRRIEQRSSNGGSGTEVQITSGKDTYKLGAAANKIYVADDQCILISEANAEASNDMVSTAETDQVEHDLEELANAEYEVPDDTSDIEVMSAIDFVKAIAAENGEYTSVIFNPFNKEFYLSLTETEIDESELAELIGDQSVVDEIKIESDFNANGWIQPRHLHNAKTGAYVKISVGGLTV